MLQIQKVKTDWSESLPGGLTWYFVGQPKSGKTTAASKWSQLGSEGVLVIDTDLGADFVDGANVVTVTSLNTPGRVKEKDGVKITKNGQPQIEAVPPDERGYFYRAGNKKGEKMPVYSLKEVVDDLKKNWHDYNYDTIVIDTIDMVNTWIEEIVTKELGIDNMGDGQWGADWAKARKKNISIVSDLQRFIKKVGANLILISHAKLTSVVDGKAQLGPQLPSGLGRSLTAHADVIGYVTCNKDNQGHYISFESYDERMIGSRLRPLAQKSLPLDYNTIMNEIKTYKEGDNAD